MAVPEYGRVYIEVVNTVTQTSFVQAVNEPIAGVHWFVVAWQFDASNDDGA